MSDDKPPPRRVPEEECVTCGDPATQWDYDQRETFCDRHVTQADFTVPLGERRVPEEKTEPCDHDWYTDVAHMAICAKCKRTEFWMTISRTMKSTLDAERAANAEMRRALSRVLTISTEYDDARDGMYDVRNIAIEALRAAEKAPATTEPAPPAGDGLTATPWGVWNLTYDTWAMPGVDSWHASREAAQRECDAWHKANGCTYEPRVRAAAEKAGER